MSTQELSAIGYDNKTPKFNGNNYAWWKNRIQNVIMGIDYECWLVVKNGPNIITKTDDKGNKVLKKDSELDTADYKLLEKNAKAMSILQQAIEPASSQGEQPRSTGEFLDIEGGKEDEEVRSEEEDLKFIGVTEETPKPLIRSRVTRSSLKKIDEVELEEQSTDSVTGTKMKRTARKSVKGMESPSVGTSDLESRVVLSGCRTEVGYFDEIALSYVKELLEFQGWLSLFDVCDANIDGVRKFYVNLKQLLDRSLNSIVNDIEVHVSVASLAGLLNIPRDGFEEYSGDGWPTLIGVSPDEIHDFVFGGKVPKKGGTFKTGGLKEPVMLVLHSLCNKMFIPRAQGRGFVRIMEMVLIYLLMTKIKINLPSLMINHIMNCYNSSHHSLPYGSYITKLLTKNNVSLSGSTAPVIVFTKGILKQKGLIFCDGVLKFREEEPAELPKPAKKKLKAEEPASQKGILKRLEKQEERMSVVGDKLDKLISLVEGLSTSFILRMSKLEKQIASSSGWAEQCNAYFIELRWSVDKYSPSPKEYLNNGIVSSGTHVVLAHAFFLMGTEISKRSLEELNSLPSIISSTATILRLWNDAGNHMDRTPNGEDGSYVDWYMKEHKISSYDIARKHVSQKISDAWKCLNKEYMSSTSPFSKDFKEAWLNLARLVPIMYSQDESHHLQFMVEP
uniref:Uncharacterized protein n=1 Tax=Chenopodium quinoa TaxID=63459 RepID=A0A803LKY7_CHEQI